MERGENGGVYDSVRGDCGDYWSVVGGGWVKGGREDETVDRRFEK
jgi:hypothetical protein